MTSTQLKPSKKPQVIFIVGTTGVGKTKLSIELAKYLNTEIISADSIQVYKHLDIASAKVSEREADGVKHHMISVVEPTEEFSVKQFIVSVNELIFDFHSRGKIPIVVGGTFYYLEGLLWDNFLSKTDDLSEQSSECEIENCSEDESTSASSPTTTDSFDYSHTRLERVDPAMARKLHPSDTRRVRRSLEIFDKTGRRHSEIIEESGGLQGITGECRLNACIMWLDSELTTLDKRLDGRVNDMISNGLLKEVVDLYGRLKDSKCSSGQVGISQAIGYKEFLPYLSRPEWSDSSEKKLCLSTCISELKSHTRRYARKQLQWIRRRLLSRTPETLPCFRFDTTDPSSWLTEVSEPVQQICKDFLAGTSSTSSPNLANLPASTDTQVESLTNWKKYECSRCGGRILNGENEWRAHLKSRSHRNFGRKKRRREMNERKREETKRKRDEAKVS
eukprot:921621_1